MVYLRVADSLTKQFLLDKVFLFFAVWGNKFHALGCHTHVLFLCKEVIPHSQTVINLLSLRVY